MREKLDKLFTRDNLVWTLTFTASVVFFAAAHTSLIPSQYKETIKDIATLMGFISGKLGWSPLNVSDNI